MNLYEESANLSCKYMSILSENELKNNNNLFNYYTKPNICNNNNDDLIQRFSYIPSININKKSCIYKKPEYNQGNWIDNHELKDINVKFNEQTKYKII